MLKELILSGIPNSACAVMSLIFVQGIARPTLERDHRVAM